MKESVLHIAAHLGGGAGKAISGLAIGMNQYVDSKVILLEEPEQDRYVKACKEHGIDVVVSRDANVIKDMVGSADYVIFSWWGHPLSVEVFKVLCQIETRVFLWSHINGLHYPHISPEFVRVFDGALFTSKCTYENSSWNIEDRKKIEDSSAIVYGMGDFTPRDIIAKEIYNESSEYKIGYSGTVSYSKMHKDFPKICGEILKRIPTATFYIYGKYDEEIYNAFMQYDSNVAERIRFEGYVENLEAKLTEFDVYCYPLNANNFATTENAILEAMAAGLPVVVLDNPAERNIIEHKVDGLIADSPETMVEYVVGIVSDASLAESLGKNARASTISKYDSKINALNCVHYIRGYSHAEKKKHDFISLVGEGAGHNFLYFSSMTFDEYAEKKVNGELEAIFMNETKGSIKHYLKYYNDDILTNLN